jgi:preprotein translocase subunit SecF
MMAGLGNLGGRLYRGDVSFNFVGRQRLWYTISGVIVLISVIALVVHGLDFSVDFTGGAVFQFADHNATSSAISAAVLAAGGGSGAIIQTVGIGSDATWEVTTKTIGSGTAGNIQVALAHTLGISQSSVNVDLVGPSWGSSISHKAVEALIVFLILVVLYLSIAFEWRMAVAALTALLHDIVITVGVYALTGFQVSPATVIGLLTILGYSLYDTVVVFDKVRENTAGILTTQRSNYSQAANLALNQTLVRSINTSIIALLPVAAILFIGAGLLGAGELKDLALVLFVGMMSGTYSSIFIATPVLADLKERDPKYRALAARVARRDAGGRAAQRATAKAGASVGGPAAGPGAAVGSSDADASVQSAPATGAARGLGPGTRATGGISVRNVSGPAADDADDTDDYDEDDDVAGDVSDAQDDQAAERQPGEANRQISRQQPRRNTAAQRRPGGSRSGARKKRR